MTARSVQHTVLVHDCPCSRDRTPRCDWSRTRACMAKIGLEEVQAAVNDFMVTVQGSREARRRTSE